MRYRWDPLYPAYARHPGPADGRNLRVSDAERGEVADALSRHFADGRLDQAEFKVRLDGAMGAVTRGDLDGLFHDLPRPDDDPVPPRPRSRVLGTLVVVLVVAALASAAVGTAGSLVHLPWLVVVFGGLLLWQRAHRHRAGTRPRRGSGQ
jgi:hypothetical protein